MSVLIKGMKMPREGCKDCRLVKRGQFYDICPFIKRIVNGNVERGGKPYDCPIIGLPDHGDLIDRDALPKYTGYALSANDVANAVINANAVIPAERSEE